MLDPEVVALLEGPSALIVGAVDEAGNPCADHCWGVEVLSAGERLRLLLNADDTDLLEGVRTTGSVACGATDVPTLRSVQLKGHVEIVEDATDADHARSERWRAGFFQAVLETDGTPIEMLERLSPRGLVAVVISVEEAFDQTPGPKAGTPIELGGS